MESEGGARARARGQGVGEGEGEGEGEAIVVHGLTGAAPCQMSNVKSQISNLKIKQLAISMFAYTHACTHLRAELGVEAISGQRRVETRRL